MIDDTLEDEEGEEKEKEEGGLRRQENKNPTLRMWGTIRKSPPGSSGSSRSVFLMVSY